MIRLIAIIPAIMLCINIAFAERSSHQERGGTIFMIVGEPIRCTRIKIAGRKIRFHPEGEGSERTISRKDVEKIVFTDGAEVIIQKRPDIIFLLNGKQVKCSVIKISSKNIEYYPAGKKRLRRILALKVNKVVFDNGRIVVINEPEESPEKKPNELKYHIGARATMFWWMPVMDLYSFPIITYPIPISGDVDIEPNVISGPFLSLEINSMVTIQAAFQAGQFKSTGKLISKPILFSTTGDFFLESQESTIIRFDSEILTSVLIKKYFITRAGIRYEGYRKQESNRHIGIGSNPFVTIHDSRIDKHSIGTEAGIGAVVPVPSLPELTFRPSFSGLFMYQVKTQTFLDNNPSLGFIAQGGISYLISKINTSIQLSFRYQYLSYLKVRSGDYTDTVEQLYGIDLSFFYTF